MIIRSAVFSASRPGMLSLTLGLIVPSLGSMANRTVHLKPWCLARILRQLRQRLLGAVFLVAADEDDVLALAGAVAAVVDDPRLPRRRQQS